MPAEAAASSNAEPAASPARPYAPSWLHELLRAFLFFVQSILSRVLFA